MPRNSSSAKAHSKAVTKYIKNNYDRIEIKLSKESHLKETIINHIKLTGENMTEFIYRAIIETLDNDAWSTEGKWSEETQIKLMEEFQERHKNEVYFTNDTLPF